MCDYYETVWTFETAQFKIELALGPEDMSPRDSFEDELADEVCDKINRGVYLWFVARVRVLWQGRVVGDDYLGGCCYESADDFRRGDGYFRDMVATAVSEARRTLANVPTLRAA